MYYELTVLDCQDLYFTVNKKNLVISYRSLGRVPCKRMYTLPPFRVHSSTHRQYQATSQYEKL